MKLSLVWPLSMAPYLFGNELKMTMNSLLMSKAMKMKLNASIGIQLNRNCWPVEEKKISGFGNTMTIWNFTVMPLSIQETLI